MMPNPFAITHYRLTAHAKMEMVRRQISEDLVAQVLADPQQVEPVRMGRDVYQSKVVMGEPPKHYLVRIFVDVERYPAEVVTVYRTSKIEKYWRNDR